MCKLMIMSGITDETQENAWAFSKAMAKEMSSPNCNEKDGLGYAAVDNEGKLFGERWVNNKEAFQHKNAYGTDIDTHILKKYKILNREKVYGNFGVFSDKIRSITMHSRSATNTVSYKNTHPFVENYTSVIHNGVIYNDDQLTKKISTCDSEVILHEYIKCNVANKIGKFKKMANRLEGYYAMGILSKNSQGLPILDIIKDGTARLEAFFIKELDTIVFATPKYNTSPVEDACKTLGFTIISKYDVKDNRIQRLNALTGETIAYESFKPKDFTRKTAVSTPTNWYEGDANEYPYGQYGGYTPKYTPPAASTLPVTTPAKDKDDIKFQDVFKKEGKVIDLTSHSKNKHVEAVKERHLEEMLLGNKEYTKDEVEKMVKESGFLEQDFNDNGEAEWSMDERLTWHKKSLA